MSIRERRRGCWEININLGWDPITGKRLRGFHSFKGTKREAQAEDDDCSKSAISGNVCCSFYAYSRGVPESMDKGPRRWR